MRQAAEPGRRRPRRHGGDPLGARARRLRQRAGARPRGPDRLLRAARRRARALRQDQLPRGLRPARRRRPVAADPGTPARRGHLPGSPGRGTPPYLPRRASPPPARLSTLVKRNLAVVFADRLLLGMLVLLPLILGGLSRVVPGSDGISIAAAGGKIGESQQRVTVLIVAACLMGTALAIREPGGGETDLPA
ncbi:hypothetical protein G5V59_11015 [Nocardioides sp. W3-2-3]|uniref:hypothetical protein n=1 Tax=Nocardioides convexus TaxID=2712224 RepID=UPI00241855FC|nr:hypothetical protein [Nocardioides convexus]NHA00422.1 hypothetical protein [Nocardioides convexus]